MHLSRRSFLAASSSFYLSGCVTSQPPIVSPDRPTIEVFSSDFASVVSADAQLETLSTGYQWAEGPVWDKSRQVLYFTDVPQNKAYIWRADEADASVFLAPSGLAAVTGFREPGANGLFIGRNGKLLVCNHGRRAIESMDIETKTRSVIVESYKGKRFNSPNDIIETQSGDLYFTDPPYGLEGLDASPIKEMAVNGVYHLSSERKLRRIVNDMTFPNGVALSPDETYLYISQSDPEAPVIRRINLHDGTEEPLWFNALNRLPDGPGLPDGMAVAASGHIFATGPGGVFVLTPEGKALGRINPGRACANCAFGEDGYTLFITAQDRLMRIRVKTLGLGWT